MRLAFRPPVTLSVCGLLALSAVSHAGQKPTLTLSAYTTRTAIPGLDKLPAGARASLEKLAAGQRSLSVGLSKPGAPPAAPMAELDVPGGLKQGPTLVLAVPSGKPDGAGSAGDFARTFENWEFRQFWGCGDAVRPGQPLVRKGKDVGAAVARAAGRAEGGAAQPATTHAYWPNDRKMGPPIAADAALPGEYLLRSNFVTGMRFQVPPGVSFLPAADITVEGGPAPDLKQPLRLRWKPVPGAVGCLAIASGSAGQNALIQWSSAEDGTHPRAWAPSGEEAGAMAQKGVYMKPDRTECTIPAGIFAGCAAVSVTFYAIGPTFEETGPAMNVRLDVLSMSSVSLLAARRGE